MKKVVSGIIACSLAAATMISAVASAAGVVVPGKDPNGDGRLTMADSTYILQVLGGRYRPSDLTQLDVDNNDVVSEADSYMTIVSTIKRNTYSISSISSENENTIGSMNVAAASTSARNYYAYSVDSNGFVRYSRIYNLSVEDDDNTASTNSIIGNDERTPDWSNRGTVKIVTSGGLGSGFVVNKHTIATAAHVVYDEDKINKVLVFEDADTPVYLTAKEIHIPVAYNGNYNEVSEYDYALITVEEDLSDYMSFNLGMVTDVAAAHYLEVGVVGFPGIAIKDGESKIVNTANKHSEYLGIGSLVYSTDTTLRYDADTSGGDSGAPIYTTEFASGEGVADDVVYYTVIGIHTNGGNYGVRFTPDVLKFLKGNGNLRY